MNNSIEHGNELHHKALAVAKEFEASGGKVNAIPSRQRSDILKGTINKKSRKKPSDDLILANLNPVEKFRAVLIEHKELTRQELRELTGLAVCTISKGAKILEVEGFLTRGPSGKGVGREVLFSLVVKDA